MSATLKSLRRLIKFRPGPFLATVGAFTALLLAGCQHPERPKAAADADWQSLIPADLVPPPHIVPPAENAVSNWLFATERLVRLKNSDDSLALATFGNLRKDGAIPATQRALFRDHLKTNAVVLAAFAAGIEQGSFSREGITNRFNLSALKSLVELRRAETRFSIEDGQWTEAGSRLTADLQVPQMMSKDSQGVIDLLFAMALQGALNEQILQMAAHSEAPTPVLRALGDQIDPWAFGRSDLVRAYRQTAFEHLTNMLAFSSFLTSPTASQAGLREMMLSEELGDLLPEVLLDPELMRHHPRPLDLSATISSQAKHFSETLNALENSSEPIELNAHSEKTASRLAEECRDLLQAAENLETPLSPDDAGKLSALYRRIENPVGRMMMSFDLLEMFPQGESRLKRVRTTTQITRLALELTLFNRQHHRWPETLQELPAVQDRPELAQDPYSSTSFHWSVRDKRISSAGYDTEFPNASPERRPNINRGLAWTGQ